MTKVILNQTVTKLGVAGDIIDVKPGFARNYLIPQNFAILWTKRAGEQAELRKAAARRKAIDTKETAIEVKALLEGSVVNVPAKSGANGKLFGSVTSLAIADSVKEQLKAVIDKRKVQISAPIKSVGPANVTVQLLDDITASLRLNVVAQSKKVA